jgi:hypothetical protein
VQAVPDAGLLSGSQPGVGGPRGAAEFPRHIFPPCPGGEHEPDTRTTRCPTRSATLGADELLGREVGS